MTDLTQSYDVIVPPLIDFMGPATVVQWFAVEGALLRARDPLLRLTDGHRGTLLISAPSYCSIESIRIYTNEVAPIGAILGTLRVPSIFEQHTDRDWANFDRLAEILAGFIGKARSVAQRRSINDALSEILSTKENSVFDKLNTDQQNEFLQHVVEQYNTKGLSPADIAQKFLQGLQVAPPAISGPAPQGPTFGARPTGPSAPGMGGASGHRVPPQQSGPLPPTDED